MKYFFDPSVGVRAFESDDSQDFLITPDMRPLTAEELEAHLNPPSPATTREQIEALRLYAYADPLTGSDRYFAEAVRLRAMGADQAEIDVVDAAGAARYAEIQRTYPWPA